MHHHHHHLELFGAYAFFIFGLLGSLHCLGMCGPLSTLFLNPNKKRVFKEYF
jgi:sulfite exporter TauE/SafE